jgi:hypothetical protein
MVVGMSGTVIIFLGRELYWLVTHHQIRAASLIVGALASGASLIWGYIVSRQSPTRVLVENWYYSRKDKWCPMIVDD